MKKTYHIKTFGCQMNYSDSERIESIMNKNGLSKAKSSENPDILIINTCGVRQMAEDRVYGLIHNTRKKSSKTKIVMTGCLANRKDVLRRMKSKVDIFCQIKDIEQIFKKLALRNMKTYSRDYLEIIPEYKNNFQAYIPIMTGCDNFCSYCVVPHARGRETSRPAEEIIKEIKDLTKKGYKSITLLGQNVNSYLDSTENKKINFPELLRKINSISGSFWIHFVSSHPKDMNDELIEIVTKSKKVCENIHLPVQAGDDEILRKMNRKYTRNHYLNIIKKIKKSFQKNKPEMLFGLTSDIIVGFPGETRKQFEKSAEVMEKCKFDLVYFGQYSPRPETAAWKMKDSVSKREKERREKYLNEILKKTTFSNNKKYVGRIEEILIEKEKNGFYFGKTRTLKNVKIPKTKKNLIGKIIQAEITKANVWNLEARLP